MKYYTLNGNGSKGYFSVKKQFQTRNQAIDYAFKFLPSSAQIEEEHDKGNHVIEYKCSENLRFFVSRHCA